MARRVRGMNQPPDPTGKTRDTGPTETGPGHHHEARPPPGETMVRTTGRMLPVRPDGRVLLLRGWDPHRPDEPFWFTVGGGIEPGETHRDAAIRELLEETGIVVDPAEVTAELARFGVEFSWRGRWVVQELVYFAVPVPSDVSVTFAGLDPSEAESIGSARWLTPAELVATGEMVDVRTLDVVRAALTAVLPSLPSPASPPSPPTANRLSEPAAE